MEKVRLQDVATHAGVSMKTVSNVIRDYPHVSVAMRDRVQQAIDELGYRPNMMGRSLATGRTGLVMLAFADIGLPYFAELARVVARAASRRGLRVLIEETEGSLEGERALLTGAEAGLVDGLLFQPSRMGSVEIAQHRAGVPLVQLGEMPAPLTIDRVQIDNVAAARAVTAHLIASGRRRIGFVGHERSGQSETSRQRLAGYQLALEEAGIQPDPGVLIASDEISAVGAMSGVSQAFENGLDVDALVCRDDLAAMGALRAVQERGLRVPDDIAITGWDDIRLSAVTYPGLTTIAADTEAMVERALEMLLERIGGYDGMGRHEQVPYSLIVRGSAPAVA